MNFWTLAALAFLYVTIGVLIGFAAVGHYCS